MVNAVQHRLNPHWKGSLPHPWSARCWASGRGREGFVKDFDNGRNMSLVVLPITTGPHRRDGPGQGERMRVRKLVKEYQVRGTATTARTLSGGNHQKVGIAKWLEAGSQRVGPGRLGACMSRQCAARSYCRRVCRPTARLQLCVDDPGGVSTTGGRSVQHLAPVRGRCARFEIAGSAPPTAG